MLWILWASAGYLSTAGSSIVDKFIVTDRIEKPAAYTFLVSSFSLLAFIFAPFGFQMVSLGIAMRLFFSGIVFSWSLFFLYKAFHGGDVSVVAPIVGIFSSLSALIPTLVKGFAFGTLPGSGIVSFMLLFIGTGCIIFPGLKSRSISSSAIWFSLLSGVLLTASFFLLKIPGNEAVNFVSGFIWSRTGTFFGGILLLLKASFRSDILDMLRSLKGSSREVPATSNTHSLTVKFFIPTWVVFIFGKTMGGIGAFLIVLSIFDKSASVAIVEALIGIQFFSIFILEALLSRKFPSVFRGELSCADWAYRGVGFSLVSFGIWCAAAGGVLLL